MRDLKIRGYTVAQFPNAPLIIALMAALASRLLDQGTTAYFVARAFFFVGLSIWAYLELVDGVNGFRRVLGAVGLAYVIFAITKEMS